MPPPRPAEHGYPEGGRTWTRPETLYRRAPHGSGNCRPASAATDGSSAARRPRRRTAPAPPVPPLRLSHTAGNGDQKLLRSAAAAIAAYPLETAKLGVNLLGGLVADMTRIEYNEVRLDGIVNGLIPLAAQQLGNPRRIVYIHLTAISLYVQSFFTFTVNRQPVTCSPASIRPDSPGSSPHSSQRDSRPHPSFCTGPVKPNAQGCWTDHGSIPCELQSLVGASSGTPYSSRRWPTRRNPCRSAICRCSASISGLRNSITRPDWMSMR